MYEAGKGVTYSSKGLNPFWTWLLVSLSHAWFLKLFILSFVWSVSLLGFPDSSRGKESACRTGDMERLGWIPGSGRILWSRKWQLTLVFLPGEPHGQRVAGSQSQLSDHACFVAGSGLSLGVVSRGYSSLQCVGFSLGWLLLLWGTGLVAP